MPLGTISQPCHPVGSQNCVCKYDVLHRVLQIQVFGRAAACIIFDGGLAFSLRPSYRTVYVVAIRWWYTLAPSTVWLLILCCNTGSLSTYFAVQYDATVQSSKGLQYSCSAYTVQTVRSTYGYSGTTLLYSQSKIDFQRLETWILCMHIYR